MIDLAKVVSSMFCILVLFIYVIILDLCGNKISPYILKATVPTQRKPHLVYSDVTVLLSLTVFLNQVSDSMPNTSDAVPLISMPLHTGCIIVLVDFGSYYHVALHTYCQSFRQIFIY